MSTTSYYHVLNGEFVIVSTRTTSFIGRLDQDTHETLLLRPSLVSEARLSLKNGTPESVPNYRLEERLPSIVNTLDVQAVQPTTKKYFFDVLNYNKPLEKTPNRGEENAKNE